MSQRNFGDITNARWQYLEDTGFNAPHQGKQTWMKPADFPYNLIQTCAKFESAYGTSVFMHGYDVPLTLLMNGCSHVLLLAWSHVCMCMCVHVFRSLQVDEECRPVGTCLRCQYTACTVQNSAPTTQYPQKQTKNHKRTGSLMCLFRAPNTD